MAGALPPWIPHKVPLDGILAENFGALVIFFFQRTQLYLNSEVLHLQNFYNDATSREDHRHQYIYLLLHIDILTVDNGYTKRQEAWRGRLHHQADRGHALRGHEQLASAAEELRQASRAKLVLIDPVEKVLLADTRIAGHFTPIPNGSAPLSRDLKNYISSGVISK